MALQPVPGRWGISIPGALPGSDRQSPASPVSGGDWGWAEIPSSFPPALWDATTLFPTLRLRWPCLVDGKKCWQRRGEESSCSWGSPHPMGLSRLC